MELFRKETNIDFMGLRKYTATFSLLLCIASIAILAINKLSFGLEFTGGTQIEMRFEQTHDPADVRYMIEQAGMKDVRVQYFGSTKDLLIRVANSNMSDEEKLRSQLHKLFDGKEESVEIRRVEYVGSEVGHQLAEQGGMAVIVAIVATMIYIALRFEYRFAVSAAVALVHDAIIVLGVFSFYRIEFDLASLAAILAVLGYSLNDTIVVFDRVRENFRKIRKGTTSQIMNVSINQTLSRTIMTSVMTLLVVLALLVYGGKTLFGFSLALTLGIVIGTYSSIYVAGAFAMMMGLSRADMLPRPKADIEELP